MSWTATITSDRAKALLVVMALSVVSLQSFAEIPVERLRDAVVRWLLGTPPPQIARIKTASGNATITRGGKQLPATPGTVLLQDDVVETGPDGTVGLTFVDNSVFSAGPDSRIALAQFRFDADTAHGDMLAELRQGTLAVVSGDITHNTPGAMHIKTPTAMLGVRGTTFAVEVARPGAAASVPRFGRCRCDSEADVFPEPVRCVAAAATCTAVCGTAQPLFSAAHDVTICGPDPRPADERYVVLPNADGRPGSGAITVDHDGKAATLDRAYAAAELSDGATIDSTMDAAIADQIFQPALQARPVLPAHFRLHFQLDSDEMTPESLAAYPALVADLKRRPSYEVQLVGYTDTLADDAHNQRLSVSRAAAVRRAMIQDGADPKAITIEGRGEAEPLVTTAQGVAEPRNRRVEVTIR